MLIVNFDSNHIDYIDYKDWENNNTPLWKVACICTALPKRGHAKTIFPNKQLFARSIIFKKRKEMVQLDIFDTQGKWNLEYLKCHDQFARINAIELFLFNMSRCHQNLQITYK